MFHSARRKLALCFGVLAFVQAWHSVASDLELLENRIFLKTPRPGVRINARTFYASNSGHDLVSVHTLLSRSDTMDVAYRRFSSDNGQSWSSPETLDTQKKTPQGSLRIYPRIGYVDPIENILIEINLQGTLPTDDPLEGMKQWTLAYRLSSDGGLTAYHAGPVVQSGTEFSPTHPFPGVFIGRNSMMIGDQSCTPITLANGDLLQPVQITPLGLDGQSYNPGGGYTYHDAAVLIGKWNPQKRIDWTLSARIVGDPARSTRGMIEPVVVVLPDRRILMVMRGSNDRKPELPGHKWFATSDDNGRTWTQPQPWKYSDGDTFYSPSSCSQILTHSSGRVFWIGNITQQNPRGNLPRYPLVIGEVDSASLGLRRDSLCEIDTRRPGDSEKLLLSNFFAREDRATGDILVHCSPVNRAAVVPNDTSVATKKSGKAADIDWTADAWLYRIGVNSTAE